ncbi:MAG: efflux RND transporter permease subunit [Deltaproteobacteria bacterium]|nr:efflux RND transporter permease subunit [Deltaproteobacteria bacterium]
MRLSEICIERPVFTTVMSLLIILVGMIAAPGLQNRELPDVDAPEVSITTVYNGAASEVVETSVTQIIERAVNGIEGVKHVKSTSQEQASRITIEFELDRDIEAAANDVRDRISRVRSKLPHDVDEPVVAKRDADARPIVWVALYGEGYSAIELTRIAEESIKDRLEKLPGVATVILGGERRLAMRIWVHNRKLGAQQFAISDVVAALRRENVDIPSGRVEGRDSELTVRSLGEMHTPEEYRRLVITSQSARQVRLSDVADVVEGAEDYRKLVKFNGQPAIGIGIVKQSKANTLSVVEAVKRELPEIRRDIPGDLTFGIAFDTSIFISESIQDVRITIAVAVLLVVLVIYVFLRSFRATIIPVVAIPVSVVGSLGVLYFVGYSINTITLMGITLAIGLVVDDAIVVLENITRWVEDGTPAMEAARRGMSEISFAVVAATVSAVSVFLPLIFLTDTTGRLFRELAVTVASAVAISGFVALTLVPMMCARVLGRSKPEGAVKRALGRAIDFMTAKYAASLGYFLARPSRTLALVLLGFLWVSGGAVLYGGIKKELMAESDRGLFYALTVGPEGATIDYMRRYQDQAADMIHALPEHHRSLSVVSLGIGTPGVVNRGIIFSQLKRDRDRTVMELMPEIQSSLASIPGIRAFTFSPSALGGFSSAPIEITVTGRDLYELARIADEIERRASETGKFNRVQADLVLNKPQLEIKVDRERSGDLGMSMEDIATTLRVMLGGQAISTFKVDGETYDVIVQLRKEERTRPADLLEIFIHGRGGLIPLAAVVSAKETVAPRAVPHRDRQRSVTLTAYLSGDYSQGEGLAHFMEIAQDVLPPDSGYRAHFSGEAEKFFESGNSIIFAYLLAILVVYLVLSAQFESFLHPLTILVAVFLSFTGALVGLKLTGMTINLFSQIGIVMLVGLVTKNSILIVEFANQLRERGQGLVEATLDAARYRFRPILMTALATVMGIAPIAAGLGAGGESRAPLGVAVVSGMIFSTFLTFFIVPATYITLERLRARVSVVADSTPGLSAPPDPALLEGEQ